MVRTVRETERTYEPDEAGGIPPLAGVAGIEAVVGREEQELENVYFDTADLRLAAAGVTLRHRTGGGETGWQLKLPAGPDTRWEIQLGERQEAGKRLRPPAELVALVRAFTHDVVLTQVATMTTARRRWDLVDAAGEVMAQLVEDTVHGHRTGADTTAVTWREVEIELNGSTDTKLLDRLDRRLEKSGLHRGAIPVKLARVLGDRWPAAPQPAPVQPRSSAGEVLLASLREQFAALRDADPQVRQQRPDSIHQMRVAARRLRSNLQAYGRIVDRDGTRELTGELKWLGEELGEARDLEVLHEHFEGEVDALPGELVLGPVSTELTRVFSPQRAAAAERALRALDGDRYLALLDALERLLEEPPLRKRARRRADAELPRQLERSYRRLQHRLQSVDTASAGAERDTALHEARKAAKRLRYAGEVARPALGKPGKRLVKHTKALQGVLGEHHDSVVARPVLRELAVRAHGEGGNGFTFGLLYEAEVQRALACERELAGRRKKFERVASRVVG